MLPVLWAVSVLVFAVLIIAGYVVWQLKKTNSISVIVGQMYYLYGTLNAATAKDLCEMYHLPMELTAAILRHQLDEDDYDLQDLITEWVEQNPTVAAAWMDSLKRRPKQFRTAA